MNLPNWLRICWWIALLTTVSWYLLQRYPSLVEGQPSAIDILAILIWAALALVPLFKEMKIFGLGFKQEVEGLKKEVEQRIDGLRAEIKNTLDVRTEISPHFSFAPFPDSQLPALEQSIRATVEDIMKDYGLKELQKVDLELETSDDVEFLFKVRYNLEKQLRRIWTSRFPEQSEADRRPFHRLVRDLLQADIIDSKVAGILREVYSICSPAVHAIDNGKDHPAWTKAAHFFVRYKVTKLIAALKAIP